MSKLKDTRLSVAGQKRMLLSRLRPQVTIYPALPGVAEGTEGQDLSCPDENSVCRKRGAGHALLGDKDTILQKQKSQGCGAKVFHRLSDDLGEAFPDMKGFPPAT